jgi:hypothetical protein
VGQLGQQSTLAIYNRVESWPTPSGIFSKKCRIPKSLRFSAQKINVTSALIFGSELRAGPVLAHLQNTEIIKEKNEKNQN